MVVVLRGIQLVVVTVGLWPRSGCRGGRFSET